MKRIVIAIFASLFVVWSVGALADDIGVVDMKQIFQTSAQVKQIQNKLKKQFSVKRDKIEKLQKSLQANVQKLQKNQSVMDKSALSSLKSTIDKQRNQLAQEGTKYQQELFKAQNAAMASFMSKIQKIVKNVASQQKIDLVLPKNGVLYSQPKMDITSKVLKQLG